MQIKATVSRIRWRGDSGWAVIDFVDDESAPFVGVGTLPFAYEGARLELTGEWTTHRIYGKQFSVSSCTEVVSDSADAAFKYLSSGIVKGVGIPMAKAITGMFGEDSLRIIEFEPKKLELVSGIGKKKSKMIHDSFMEKRGLQEMLMGMQQLGFSVAQSVKIHKLYGDNCVALIKENPYRLISDVDYIGFRTADKIAQNAGFEYDSPFRIKAGLRHTLNEARLEGNTCLPKEMLAEKAGEILGVDIVPVENCLEEMITACELIEKRIENEDRVFLSYLHYAEMHSAVCLMELKENFAVLPMFDIEGEIDRLERKYAVELAEKQRDAVRKAFSEGVLVITGGPGTGKTTILSFIIEIMERMQLQLELAAPTGRAAKRMNDTTGRDARTIHRLLEYGGLGNEEFARDETCPIEADVVIVDEMSMVDISLFHSLLKAIAPGTRLIMVGDFDQLPSVGAGNVLRDVILSDSVPVIRLTDIYRQAGRSMIIVNAHRINRGLIPVTDANESDFVFLSRPDAEDALNTVIDMCTEFSSKGLEGDFQVLAPMKANLLGVNNLNSCLQKALNPPDETKRELARGEYLLRVGDRVMQIKNNYNIVWTKERRGASPEEGAGVYNGDIGTVMNISPDRKTVRILFDDERTAEYDQSELDEIELAYAISIHKSQGSEFSTVILPLVYGPPMLMNRNILYTAVTRARNRVCIVGSAKCVERMIHNVMSAKRYSALEYFLRQLCFNTGAQ